MSTYSERPRSLNLTAKDLDDIGLGIPVLAATVTEGVVDELSWFASEWSTKGRIRRWYSLNKYVAVRLPVTGPAEYVGESLYRVLDVLDTGKSIAETKDGRAAWTRRRDAIRQAFNDVTVTVA